MAKNLVIHPERCTACRACELACSMMIRTRQSFGVTPEQLTAGPVAWGRILRDNRLAGAAARLQ
ncbi:MAG TPA: 4Fe-4S binding protein [Candidatus Methylomirabilis sp.]